MKHFLSKIKVEILFLLLAGTLYKCIIKNLGFKLKAFFTHNKRITPKRVVKLSIKKVINFLSTFKKLLCKEEPYRFSC